MLLRTVWVPSEISTPMSNPIRTVEPLRKHYPIPLPPNKSWVECVIIPIALKIQKYALKRLFPCRKTAPWHQSPELKVYLCLVIHVDHFEGHSGTSESTWT